MNIVQPIRCHEKIGQLKNALKQKNNKYYIMFVIGLNTGLRVGDMLKLRASDVRQKTHIIITEQKTEKKRRVYINDRLRDEMERYIDHEGLDDNDFLIWSRNGDNRPITRIQAYRVLSETAKEIGLEEIGTHTMRKTFGYWHYKEHKDVAVLQEIFNHSTPSVTLRYIGINEDIKDETLKNFFI
jgi:integrase